MHNFQAKDQYSKVKTTVSFNLYAKEFLKNPGPFQGVDLNIVASTCGSLKKLVQNKYGEDLEVKVLLDEDSYLEVHCERIETDLEFERRIQYNRENMEEIESLICDYEEDFESQCRDLELKKKSEMDDIDKKYDNERKKLIENRDRQTYPLKEELKLYQ